MPKTNNASPKCQTFVLAAHPIFTNDKGYNMEAILSILLLPCLAVKLPDKGMPKKDPNGRNKSIPPNCASVNPNAILISGIRLAQLAKQIPV